MQGYIGLLQSSNHSLGDWGYLVVWHLVAVLAANPYWASDRERDEVVMAERQSTICHYSDFGSLAFANPTI
jgi:hypothetical protein